ncbi:MAG: hypothetical protein HYT98_00925 [Candidatus Sungbacteria bacterium]|nr:hypothetical protein [Candidatus Sungbacteria bacterium]
MDERTKNTIYWSAIGSAVYGVIIGIATFVSVRFFTIPGGGAIDDLIAFGIKSNYFGLGNFIYNIVLSVIGGAIGGVIFSMFFDFWLKLARILFGWAFNITNIFQLCFYPSLAIWIIFGILGGLSGLGVFGGIVFWLINAIGGIVGIYAFALIMQQGVGKYYDPIIQGSASNSNG